MFDQPLLVAFIMSSFAATMTTIGSLIVLFIPLKKKIIETAIDIGLGFGSGVMLVASFLSLLVPSIQNSNIIITLLGFCSGAAAIAFFNWILPHKHLFKNSLSKKIKAAWLVALAIIIHNFPEGFAIGITSSYSTQESIKVGLAIGFQDLPEGLAVSLPILAITKSKLIALVVGGLSGFSEVISALPASFFGMISPFLLYFLMAFGAGAMIFVVSNEAIPESHRSGKEKEATLGFISGFIIMLILDSIKF